MSFRRRKPTSQDKRKIIKRIEDAAEVYKEVLVGKTFLIFYEGHSVEIIFRSNNFMHLCGVDSRLKARDFYRKALRKELRSVDICFSNETHPYHYADIKTKHLIDAFNMIRRESLVITDITTYSRSFKLGTTDFEIVICFDAQTDECGNAISNILNPFSLRIEEISNDKYNELYEVDFVISKRTEERAYNCIEYGSALELKDYLMENDCDDYLINISDLI